MDCCVTLVVPRAPLYQTVQCTYHWYTSQSAGKVMMEVDIRMYVYLSVRRNGPCVRVLITPSNNGEVCMIHHSYMYMSIGYYCM